MKGVHIEWAPNPLETKIRLDEDGVALLRQGVAYEADLFAKVGEVMNQERVFKYSLSSLQESHYGNCLNNPWSCSKCAAEEYLGINTLEGSEKQWRHYIRAAFEARRTIDDAIRWLKTSEITGPEERVAKWRAQRVLAANWLQSYKEAHKF